MFTGFPSTNTPAIQVWNFNQSYTGTARISLEDDCAPIQYFKTGANTSSILLYLPSTPIEGKQIKIVNANYTSTNQSISIYSSDTRGAGTTTPFIIIGPGCTIDLCYSKDFINVISSGGQFYTGWISLNQTHIGAFNYNAVALGGNDNSAVTQRSAVLGGSFNTASGSSSVVVGGGSNTASSTVSGIFAGQNNAANNTAAVAVGGSGNSASAGYSSVMGGQNNSATSANSVVLGGTTNGASGSESAVLSGANNNATASSSVVVGGAYGTTRGINGATVFPASITPITTAAGVSQSSILIMGRQTTDATATVLTSNTVSATTTNQVILPNNSAYYFRGSVIANVTGGGNTKAWSFEGAIKRGANAAATTLIQSVINPVAEDSGASTWSIALAADTTNGGLQVTVTGQAATTIRWVCKVETTEVTF